MDANDALGCADLGQSGEGIAGDIGERARGPAGGFRGAGVEVVEREGTDCRGIMVSEDAFRIEGGETRDDLVRLRAVADDIAHVPDGVGGDGSSRRENSFEGCQVRVDVGDEKDAHPGRVASSGVKSGGPILPV